MRLTRKLYSHLHSANYATAQFVVLLRLVAPPLSLRTGAILVTELGPAQRHWSGALFESATAYAARHLLGFSNSWPACDFFDNTRKRAFWLVRRLDAPDRTNLQISHWVKRVSIAGTGRPQALRYSGCRLAQTTVYRWNATSEHFGGVDVAREASVTLFFEPSS